MDITHKVDRTGICDYDSNLFPFDIKLECETNYNYVYDSATHRWTIQPTMTAYLTPIRIPLNSKTPFANAYLPQLNNNGRVWLVLETTTTSSNHMNKSGRSSKKHPCDGGKFFVTGHDGITNNLVAYNHLVIGQTYTFPITYSVQIGNLIGRMSASIHNLDSVFFYIRGTYRYCGDDTNYNTEVNSRTGICSNIAKITINKII